jgi:hypothetical protein
VSLNTDNGGGRTGIYSQTLKKDLSKERPYMAIVEKWSLFEVYTYF